jgi:CrcB protein
MNVLIVFIGGGIGCVIRYLIGYWFQKTNLGLPVSTFISNILACLIFAITLWFINSKDITNTQLKLLILTGFCGGLSTFSTFGYETFLLFKQGLSLYASLNIIISTGLSLLIFNIFK